MGKLPDTARGFRVYADIIDRYGSAVTVQESSLADADCVWIFCKNDTEPPGVKTPPAPHLTVEQATVIRDALTEFILEHAPPDRTAQVYGTPEADR